MSWKEMPDGPEKLEAFLQEHGLTAPPRRRTPRRRTPRRWSAPLLVALAMAAAGTALGALLLRG